MAVTFGKLQLKKAEAGMLGFDYNGVYILDPTLDETARFTVDPIKYYWLNNYQLNAMVKANSKRIESLIPNHKSITGSKLWQ